MVSNIARTGRGVSAARNAAVALAATALLIAACGDDDGESIATVPTLPTTTSAPPTTEQAPTTTTPPPPTEPAPATAPATVATTAPATTAPGQRWTGDVELVESPLMSEPFAMQRVTQVDGLSIYDGTSEAEGFAVRCVVVVRTGDTTWREWCTSPADLAGTFALLDGIDPLLVEVGPQIGDVSLTRQPSDWTLVSNGCDQSVVAMLSAAELGPAVATGLVCVPGEAFLTFAAVMLQPGPPDGGGMLLVDGDEGWNTDGGGTSIPCSPFDDGVDRCALFGVTGELFEAALPIPVAAFNPQADTVAVRDDTAGVKAIAEGDAPNAQAVADRLLDELAPPEPEVPPSSAVLQHGSYDLIVIDVPAMDDSVRSTTWAVWTASDPSGGPVRIVRATAWENCARGVADGDLCV